MITKTPLENLLGPTYNLVILDTFVLRTLMHENKIPDWQDTFIKAKEKGCSFSLSFHAALEILNFLQRDDLGEAHKKRGFERAEQFIERKLPICPEDKHLTFLAGIRGEPDCTSLEVSEFSQKLWHHLKTQNDFPDSQIIQDYVDAQKQEHQEMLRRLMQYKNENPGLSKNDRKKRSKDYEQLLADSIMTSARLPENHPEVAEAFAVFMGHCFDVILQNESYSPEKRVNDGIDKLLFMGLLVPSSYVITEERWMRLARERGSSSWSWRILTPTEFLERFKNDSLVL